MKYEKTWLLTDREGNKTFNTVINYRFEKDMRTFLLACGYDESLFVEDKKMVDGEIMNHRLLCNFEFYNFDSRRPLTYKIITDKYTDNYSYKFY
jgi:hypothetical protein